MNAYICETKIEKACQHMKQLYAKLMYTRCKLVSCPSGNIT